MNERHFTAAALAATFLLASCVHRTPDGAGILVDFPVKELERSCDNKRVCKIKVYARIAPSGSCEVMPEVEDVRIGVGYQPKMHWKIDSIDPGRPYDYRFAFQPSASPPVYGIEIRGNNPALDFDKPGHDVDWAGRKDVTTFKWDNKHGRSLPNDPFYYDVNVERSPHNQDNWSACARVDPRMYND